MWPLRINVSVSTFAAYDQYSFEALIKSGTDAWVTRVGRVIFSPPYVSSSLMMKFSIFRERTSRCRTRMNNTRIEHGGHLLEKISQKFRSGRSASKTRDGAHGAPTRALVSVRLYIRHVLNGNVYAKERERESLLPLAVIGLKIFQRRFAGRTFR